MKDETLHPVTLMNLMSKTIERLVVSQVKPEGYYAVRYAIQQDGEKVYGNFRIQGKDLTAPQIVEFAAQGVFT